MLCIFFTLDKIQIYPSEYFVRRPSDHLWLQYPWLLQRRLVDLNESIKQNMPSFTISERNIYPYLGQEKCYGKSFHSY